MKKLSFLTLCASALLMGLSACTGNQNNNAATNEADEQQVFIGDDIAIAQTQYGKVQGFMSSASTGAGTLGGCCSCYGVWLLCSSE